MNTELQHLSALQLIDDLDRRAITSCIYVESIAKQYPLEKRRTIVRHIKECREEAQTHQEIPDFAQELRNYLIHDFWDRFNMISAQTEFHKQKLEDFAVIATMNAPAHQSSIQNVIYNIVPEDIPEHEQQRRKEFAEFLKKYNDDCYCY